jgi:hypothetical protein
MSEKARPKFSFSRKLGGGEFLNVAVWPGKSNHQDEIESRLVVKGQCVQVVCRGQPPFLSL